MRTHFGASGLRKAFGEEVLSTHALRLEMSIMGKPPSKCWDKPGFDFTLVYSILVFGSQPSNCSCFSLNGLSSLIVMEG